jgi:hypothetical protein
VCHPISGRHDQKSKTNNDTCTALVGTFSLQTVGRRSCAPTFPCSNVCHGPSPFPPRFQGFVRHSGKYFRGGAAIGMRDDEPIRGLAPQHGNHGAKGPKRGCLRRTANTVAAPIGVE